MKETWIKWTVLEAFCRTTSMVLQKVAASTNLTLGHTIFAATVIGFVQTVAGAVVVRAQRQSFIDCAPHIFGAVTFGTLAYVNTLLGLTAFSQGAEVGTFTFIITLSIIPGALIDRFVFGRALVVRQWLGIIVAVVAGYLALGAPSLEKALQLPTWVWLSAAASCGVAINQGVTQKIKNINPFVKNFWGGLTAVVLGVASAWFVPIGQGTSQPELERLTTVSMCIGFVVVAMWSFNVLSYKHGAYLALKKLVSNGSWLAIATIAGTLIFRESLSSFKIMGFILYGLAFVIVDEATWRFVTRKSS